MSEINNFKEAIKNFNLRLKFNPNHEPAGSSDGGQFASGEDGVGDSVDVTGYGKGKITENYEKEGYYVDFNGKEKFFDKRTGKFADGKWVADYSFIESDGTVKSVQEKLADIGVFSSVNNSNKSESEYLKVGISKFRISDHNFHHFNGDGNFYKGESADEIFSIIKKVERL